MLPPSHLRGKEKMSIYFTSDTHFGHGNIIKYCHRPYLSPYDKEVLEREGQWHNGDWKGPTSSKHRISNEAVTMMNDELINNINAMVGQNDTLWHLGDWCFAGKHEYNQKAKYYRDRIVCRNVNIIWGNHDHRSIRHLFGQSEELYHLHVDGQLIVLCHYAMAVWDGSHRGSWNLYGHSHAGAEKWMDANLPGRRSFDVGVDNAAKVLGAYRPWSLAEIKKIMDARNGFSMDHHIPRNSTAPREEELAH
jgi:calcineurin-like phosphoesterase family protein